MDMSWLGSGDMFRAKEKVQMINQWVCVKNKSEEVTFKSSCRQNEKVGKFYGIMALVRISLHSARDSFSLRVFEKMIYQNQKSRGQFSVAVQPLYDQESVW